MHDVMYAWWVYVCVREQYCNNTVGMKQFVGMHFYVTHGNVQCTLQTQPVWAIVMSSTAKLLAPSLICMKHCNMN